MRVLVCGASGFVGAALCECLERAGHEVVRGVRRPRGEGEVAIDFTRDLDAADWLPRLAGMDAVVNAVGIIVERGAQRFETLHRRAPCALFDACVQAGVGKVVQISALGAEQGDTPYFLGKRAADEHLMSLPLGWQVLRPALVYGAQGGSARLFRLLASLPVVFLPAGGRQLLQPVHVDDVAEAVLRLLDPATPARQCIDLVGPAPVTYREMLRAYRCGLGFGPALEIPLPGALVGAAAVCSDLVSGALLNRDTWKMLQAGNTGDAAATAALLGRQPRAMEAFFPPGAVTAALRQQALADWRESLLRLVLAAVWIVTALVSLFIHPVEDSLELLGRVGLRGEAALAALYGAAGLDLAFGIATLVRPGRRLWLFQAAVILGYSAIIAAALPEFLAHPFGPITKNLPILAILLLLHAESPVIRGRTIRQGSPA